ncbi:hypothetical protein METY_2605 [Methylopila sp. Yamaguchi]|nr:hypothetical protein METY_2605 [Methylopila sp. Yamaguchi]
MTINRRFAATLFAALGYSSAADAEGSTSKYCKWFENLSSLPNVFTLDGHVSFPDNEADIYLSDTCECLVYYRHPEVDSSESLEDSKKKMSQATFQKLSCSERKTRK